MRRTDLEKIDFTAIRWKAEKIQEVVARLESLATGGALVWPCTAWNVKMLTAARTRLRLRIRIYKDPLRNELVVWHPRRGH